MMHASDKTMILFGNFSASSGMASARPSRKMVAPFHPTAQTVVIATGGGGASAPANDDLKDRIDSIHRHGDLDGALRASAGGAGEAEFLLGGLLAKAQVERRHRQAGYGGRDGWRRYVEAEAGLDHRHACALKRFYTRLSGLNAPPETVRRFARLGRSKTSNVMKVITADNLGEICALGERLNRADLTAAVRERFGSPTPRPRKPKAATADPAPPSSLTKEQAAFVDSIMTSLEALPSVATREQAVHHLIVEWVFQGGAQPPPLAETVAAVERRHGVRLRVEPSPGDVSPQPSPIVGPNPNAGRRTRTTAPAKVALGKVPPAVADDAPPPKLAMRTPLRYLSLFSGAEAAGCALEALGADARPLAFSEVDPAACAFLKQRFPNVENVGDITRADFTRFQGAVDLLAGGPPCQSFSVAGKRLGRADDRGRLYDDYLRALEETRATMFLFENVPGLLSSGGGQDFALFKNRVRELGYSCCERILDAQDFGLPQSRRRLYVVGYFGDDGARADAVLFERGQCGGAGPAFLGAWRNAAAPFRRRARAGGAPVSAAVGPQGETVNGELEGVNFRHLRTTGDATHTLQAKSSGGWSLNYLPGVIQDGRLRRLTPLETMRLQGFPDDWFDGVRLNGRPLGDGHVYRMMGNSWPAPVVAWILERMIMAWEERIPAQAA